MVWQASEIKEYVKAGEKGPIATVMEKAKPLQSGTTLRVWPFFKLRERFARGVC